MGNRGNDFRTDNYGTSAPDETANAEKYGRFVSQKNVSEAVYKYSKDRLTDTATHISGTIDCFISKYSQDGHLLYRSDYFPRKVELDGKVYPDREWNILKYTYGDDGRLLKTEN